MPNKTRLPRWRRLKTTAENFERLYAFLVSEIEIRNRTVLGLPELSPSQYFKFTERRYWCSASATLTINSHSIRFVLHDQVRLFEMQRDPTKPNLLRKIHPDEIKAIEHRRIEQEAR